MGKVINFNKKVVASPILNDTKSGANLSILRTSIEGVIFRFAIILLIHFVFGGLVVWSMKAYMSFVFSFFLALIGEGLILLAMISGIKYEIAKEQEQAKKTDKKNTLLTGRILPLLPTMQNDKARAYFFVLMYLLFIVFKIAFSSYATAAQEKLSESDTLKLNTSKMKLMSDTTTIAESKKTTIRNFEEKRDNELKDKLNALNAEKREILAIVAWLQKTGQSTSARQQQLDNIEAKIKNVSANSKWNDSISENTKKYNTQLEIAIKDYEKSINGISNDVKTNTEGNKLKSIIFSCIVGVFLFVLIIVQKKMYKDVMILHFVFDAFKREKEVVNEKNDNSNLIEVKNKEAKVLVESVVIDGKSVTWNTAVSWTNRKNTAKLMRLKTELQLKGYETQFTEGYIRIFEQHTKTA